MLHCTGLKKKKKAYFGRRWFLQELEQSSQNHKTSMLKVPAMSYAEVGVERSSNTLDN